MTKRCLKKFCIGDEIKTTEPVTDVCDMGQRAKVMRIEGDMLALKLKKPRHWQSEYIYLFPKEIEKVK